MLMLLSLPGGYAGYLPPPIGYGGGSIGFVVLMVLIVPLLH
jgi:hypothetical protein